MPKKKTPLQILRRVRKLLKDQHRWTRFSYYDAPVGSNQYEGAFCLIGAAQHAAGLDPTSEALDEVTRPEVKAAAKLLARQVPKGQAQKGARGVSRVVSFNDFENRSHDEVLELVDRAIEAAKREALVLA